MEIVEREWRYRGINCNQDERINQGGGWGIEIRKCIAGRFLVGWFVTGTRFTNLDVPSSSLLSPPPSAAVTALQTPLPPPPPPPRARKRADRKTCPVSFQLSVTRKQYPSRAKRYETTYTPFRRILLATAWKHRQTCLFIPTCQTTLFLPTFYPHRSQRIHSYFSLFATETTLSLSSDLSSVNPLHSYLHLTKESTRNFFLPPPIPYQNENILYQYQVTITIQRNLCRPLFFLSLFENDLGNKIN